MKLLTRVTTLAIVITLAGCGTFSGDIVFKNKSAKKVWVKVDGFERNPPGPGTLSPNATKSAGMGRMLLPDQVTIYWSHKLHKLDQTSIIVIDKAVTPKGNEELIFTFTGEERWEVHSE